MGCGIICFKCFYDSNDRISHSRFCSIDELKHESFEIETLKMKKMSFDFCYMLGKLVLVFKCVKMGNSNKD